MLENNEFQIAKKLALDTNRVWDVNQFMSVKNCVITAAGVYEYLGREIPNFEAFGLNPDEIYRVYRPADEIAKSVDTFNNMPLLDEHVVVFADDLPKDHIIGNLGSDMSFDGKNLKGTVIFWDKTAVDDLSNGKRGLSAGYRYTPILESGTFEGISYTIRMINLQANHVAHVDNPRTPSAMVQDSADNLLKMEKPKMKKIKGAALAADAKAAKDADTSEGSMIDKIIDIMQASSGLEEKRDQLAALIKGAADEEKEDKKDKESEDCYDEDLDDKEKKAAEDEEADEKDDKKDKKENGAMDSARIIELAKQQAQKQIAEYNEAIRLCEPLLGRVNSLALDTAEKLYTATLKLNEIALDGANYETRKAMVKVLAQTRNINNNQAMIAKDSQSISGTYNALKEQFADSSILSQYL